MRVVSESEKEYLLVWIPKFSPGEIVMQMYYVPIRDPDNLKLVHFGIVYYINSDLIEGNSAFCQPEETLLTEAVSTVNLEVDHCLFLFLYRTN